MRHHSFRPGRQHFGLLALCLPLGLQAAPEHTQVVHGDVEFSQTQPGHTEIHQHSEQAIVEYQTFSLAEGESLQIYQPSAQSALLNRVTGGELSEIHGRIDANGQMFIVNEAGVVFGEGSQIDVGGLVVSTLDISDGSFLAGQHQFQQGNQALGQAAGTIRVHGRIATAEGGYVVLLAEQIVQAGRIVAPDGQILMGTAQTVQLDTRMYLQDPDSPIAWKLLAMPYRV